MLSSWKEALGGTGLVIAQLYDQQSQDHRGCIVVRNIFLESPVRLQGSQKGDVITHVDHQPLAGKTLAELVLGKMRGWVSSAMALTIKRLFSGFFALSHICVRKTPREEMALLPSKKN